MANKLLKQSDQRTGREEVLEPDLAGVSAGDAPSSGGAGLRPATRRPGPMLPVPLTLIIFGLTYWCVDIVSPTLPVIQEDLMLSGAGAGLVMSIFFFGRLVTNFPAAFLIERVGPRGCAVLGSLILALGSAGAALAPGESLLLLMRGLQGGGVALLATAGLLSVLRAWPGGGAAMTAFNLSAGVGGGIGLVSGGLITAELGWRGVFGLCAGLALVMLIGLLIVQTVQGGRRSRATTVAAPEDRPASLVMGRGLAASIAANLLVYVNYGIWVVALALLAAERFDASPSEIGTLLLVVNIIHLSAAVPVGRAIRRVGAPRAMAAGFGVGAVGISLIIMAPSFVWLFPPMMLYAVGQITCNSAAGDLVLRLGGGGGRAVGLLRLTSDVGLVAGPVMIGLLADAAGVRAPFVVLAAVTAAGAGVTWWIGNRGLRPPLSSPA